MNYGNIISISSLKIKKSEIKNLFISTGWGAAGNWKIKLGNIIPSKIPSTIPSTISSTIPSTMNETQEAKSVLVLNTYYHNRDPRFQDASFKLGFDHPVIIGMNHTMSHT